MTKDNPPTRGQLLRQILVFQFKLAMDGIRDVLLSPISVIAALAGILTNNPTHPVTSTSCFNWATGLTSG